MSGIMSRSMLDRQQAKEAGDAFDRDKAKEDKLRRREGGMRCRSSNLDLMGSDRAQPASAMGQAMERVAAQNDPTLKRRQEAGTTESEAADQARHEQSVQPPSHHIVGMCLRTPGVKTYKPDLSNSLLLVKKIGEEPSFQDLLVRNTATRTPDWKLGKALSTEKPAEFQQMWLAFTSTHDLFNPG